MSTEQLLLKAVLASPDDDLPRLVMADWYDENGQPERAEFIRLDIHADRLEETCPCRRCVSKRGGGWDFKNKTPCLITKEMDERNEELRRVYGSQWVTKIWASPKVEGRFRRGFIGQISLLLADWVGGACWRCHNDAYFRSPDEVCPSCHGTLTSPPFGPQLISQHPLEVVTLTDCEPSDRTAVNERWYWFRHERGNRATPAHLPSQFFPFLPRPHFDPVTLDIIGIPYETRDSALNALSYAAIAWAKAENRRLSALADPWRAGD